MASISSPDHECYDDECYDDEMIQTSYCGCLWLFYGRALPCGRRNGYGVRGRYLLQQQGQVPRQSWLLQNVKKAKEFSEILAGPKWKNFIRSIGAIYKKRRVQAMYDPQSYVLNFDEGVGREAENPAYLHFSSAGYAVASTFGMNQGKT